MEVEAQYASCFVQSNPIYGYRQMMNGKVFSEQNSELTCNISRKRIRQQPQQQMSSGFQQENRLNGSGGTSTSGQSSMVSSFLASSCSQNLEMDALIQQHGEILRRELEESQSRHCRSVLSVLKQQVVKKLEEKEAELGIAIRRNAELEEIIKQMSAENQIWFNVARNNEVMASSLRSSLEQMILQTQNQIKEGFGDSDDIVALADNAQPSCNEGDKMIRKNNEIKEQRCCKVCHENEISVLVLPCRHLCLCTNCEWKVDSCPTCNSPKNATLQVFIS